MSSISTSARQFDIVGVGNAIVDVLAPVPDEFLARHAIERASMTLIDQDRAETLYRAFPPAREISGGSAANSLAGAASLGSACAFIGRVANDQLGEVFTHDLRAGGVYFQPRSYEDGPATARSLIAVTQDSQRSMSTFLGCSSLLGPQDIDPQIVAAARIAYLEGYLFDREDAKRAFLKTVDIAHASGNRAAISLSDTFCVERHRRDFLELIRSLDIVISNEAECKSLFQTDDFDQAFAQLASFAPIVVVTRSEKGALIAGRTSQGGRDTFVVTALPVSKIIDTTGAGDLFAGGFLHGLSQGFELARSGQLGALAAAEIISHYGARPEISLRDQAEAAGLLSR